MFLRNALHFKIDISCLTRENTPYCKECGLYYASDIPSEVEFHSQKHIAWENAVKKYGFCWPYSVREEIKAESNAILASDTSTPADKIDAAIDILKCYFSRSLESAQYNLKHVEFSEYVAMLLGQGHFKERFGEDVWESLSNLYGTKEGITNGTYYHIEGMSRLNNEMRTNINKNDISTKTNTKTIKTIAAHLEGAELKENQIEDVLNFIDFIKQKDL